MFKSITKFPIMKKKKQRNSDESQPSKLQKKQQEMLKRRKSLDNFRIQNDLQFFLQQNHKKHKKSDHNRRLKKSQTPHNFPTYLNNPNNSIELEFSQQ